MGGVKVLTDVVLRLLRLRLGVGVGLRLLVVGVGRVVVVVVRSAPPATTVATVTPGVSSPSPSSAPSRVGGPGRALWAVAGAQLLHGPARGRGADGDGGQRLGDQHLHGHGVGGERRRGRDGGGGRWGGWWWW